ncbi:MAG: dihydrolipoamide dehydrogenase [Alphaproteobacteria bacterium]|nr:dihydrolipoamide dehydrogenase [Alphaproteobacteria bacterium]
MSQTLDTDICVIGAGSGGLSVAAGAAQLGVPTVLIEKSRMGGDCLNYGCVPSKALLAAGKAAQSVRIAAKFGVSATDITVDFARTMEHVQGVIAAIAPNDSVERFTGLGCTVIQAAARFISPREVEVGGHVVQARRFVIATGSRASIPPVPGLDQVPFLTNETIFENRVCPEHLIILGAGPIGMEMAQAHRRLGARVTIIEMARALMRDDPELAAVTIKALRDEGAAILENTEMVSVALDNGGAITVIARGKTGEQQIIGSHLLVATGRQPNIEGLGLEAANIAFDRKGIKTNAGLRTTNRRVYAIGDVTGGPLFTHVAGYHAGLVIRSALFRSPAKLDHSAIPRVTYTDPELAQAGLTEEDAVKAGISHRVLRWRFEENDRAQAERRTEGLAKIITGRGGAILGAGLVGANAGELLQPWILAMARKQKIGAMTGLIAPYPTLGEINKRVAGSYYTPALFSRPTRMLVSLLRRFG